jgi:hypothetical protein
MTSASGSKATVDTYVEVVCGGVIGPERWTYRFADR